MERVNMVFFLKPDAVIRRYVGARTLKTLLDEVGGIKLKVFLKVSPSREFLANQHYVEHKGKFFFNWLLDFTTVAPIYFTIIEVNPKEIEEIRRILGPTLVQKAAVEAPGSIRGKYGIYGGVNVAHASDSKESAIRESEVWIRYLKDKYGDKIFNRPTEVIIGEIEKYIDEYIDYPIIDNTRYLELSTSLERDPSRKDEIREKFIQLLSKETSNDFLRDENIIRNLANVLIRNALLRK